MSPSLIRAASTARRAAATSAPLQSALRRTLASTPAKEQATAGPSSSVSSDHSAEHEHAEADKDVYPKEGFNSSIWGYTVLAVILAGGFSLYAPEANENAYLTQWIAKYTTPTEYWKRLNFQHLLLEHREAVNKKLSSSGQKPIMHRYRFPMSLDRGSPHKTAVGMDVDVSSVQPRQGKDVIF